MLDAFAGVVVNEMRRMNMAEYYRKKQPSCTTPDGREWFASGGGNTNPEYVEREAVMDKCGWYNTVNGKSVCAVRKDELASIPAADVVPVVHGRWEHLEVGCFDLWRCSACGDEWTFEYDPTDAETKVNYCPNCGARMDGE